MICSDFVNIRWALSNQGDEEVHVVYEGDKIWTGVVQRLVFISRCCIFVDIDNTIPHASDVAEARWEVLCAERILTRLRRRGEDCNTTLMLYFTEFNKHNHSSVTKPMKLQEKNKY